MRLTQTFVDAVQAALEEKINSSTPVGWADIVQHIKDKGIAVTNWLHVRAVLQSLGHIKRVKSVHVEEYYRG